MTTEENKNAGVATDSAQTSGSLENRVLLKMFLFQLSQQNIYLCDCPVGCGDMIRGDSSELVDRFCAEL